MDPVTAYLAIKVFFFTSLILIACRLDVGNANRLALAGNQVSAELELNSIKKCQRIAYGFAVVGASLVLLSYFSSLP